MTGKQRQYKIVPSTFSKPHICIFVTSLRNGAGTSKKKRDQASQNLTYALHVYIPEDVIATQS